MMTDIIGHLMMTDIIGSRNAADDSVQVCVSVCQLPCKCVSVYARRPACVCGWLSGDLSI
jgi:hypothetical protein